MGTNVNTSFASLIMESDEDVEATNSCSVHLKKLRAYDYDMLFQPTCAIGPNLNLATCDVIKPFSTCDIGPPLDEILQE